jgi:hypothetical protein
MNSPYGWEPLYRSAVLETDDVKLRNLIDEARMAINVRFRELVLDGFNAEERQAIEHALHGLKVLREERCQPSVANKS